MKRSGTIAVVGNMWGPAFEFIMNLRYQKRKHDAYQDLSRSWGPPARFDPQLFLQTCPRANTTFNSL